MTGTSTDAAFGPCRATVRSAVPDAATVAAAIAPDDTDEIGTRVDDGAVVTTIERPTTGSLEATLDDYVVALDVATAITEIAREAPTRGRGDVPTDANTDAPADAATEERTDTTTDADTDDTP